MAGETRVRKLRVTLEVTVRDLTAEELEQAGLADLEAELEDDLLPDSEAVSGEELSVMIANSLAEDETQNEMFAGSGFLVRLADIRPVAFSWEADNGR